MASLIPLVRWLSRPGVTALVLLLATAFVATGQPSASAHAQVERDGPTAKYTVIVNRCLAPGCTEDASLIEPVDGVSVTVSNADDGEVFSSCVTGDTASGQCVVDIRLVTTLAFTFDESTLPEGYRLDANPQIVPNQATEPGAHAELPVLLYPEGGFPPDANIYNAPVRAMICSDASCGQYVEGIYGVDVSAVDVFSGAVLDRCTTDAGNQIGGCALAIPADATFVLDWDEADIPAGLVPFDYPIHEVIASGGLMGYTLGFYETSPAAPIPTPAPAPTVVAPQPPAQPSAPEGLPAGVYEGSCADGQLGERIVQLNGPAVPEGAQQGAMDAIPVGVGYTVIDVPFRDMLNGGMVIAVFDDANPDTMIACGPVGGILDTTGAFSMGLAPVGDSGAVGVAYLNAQQDATATGISLFLVERPVIGPSTPAA
jgi:hypothetical protein